SACEASVRAERIATANRRVNYRVNERSITRQIRQGGSSVDRRTFAGALVGGLLVSPSASAQSPTKVYRVGFVLGATRESVAPLLDGLRDGMRDLGYVEGNSVVFEQRYAGGNVERLPDLAAELVRLRVDVIVTGTNLHVAAVRRATATIPIV